MRSLLLATALVLIAGPLSAQDDSLLHFAIRTALDPGFESRPVICVGIRRSPDGPMEDYGAQTGGIIEIEGSVFVGHSECEKSARGSFHRATGRPATVLEIGLGEAPGVFTVGFHLHGTYAGASECTAHKEDDEWQLGDCRPLWIS
ncbi:MAG: hypothetical protein IH968_09810 [Gemmatimonadetes bacterium]|nr:hypothetical protein [Gemmatimonadota bacterium]